MESRRFVPLSEQMDACVTRSSDELKLSSSRLVSCVLLLFCEKKSLSTPLAVTHSNALFSGLGW